ncbi:MAG: transposase [Gammaproteobacteria bacterium]
MGDACVAPTVAESNMGYVEYNRKSVRLKGYDYGCNGAYFITVCTRNREYLFGKVTREHRIELNITGNVALTCWKNLPEHFPPVNLDTFIIMPNHIHGILYITSTPTVGATHASPMMMCPSIYLSPNVENTTTYKNPRGPKRGSVAAIIGAYKSTVSRQSGMSIWQRGYYEHIIRDENELNRTREYIINNPAQWGLDQDNKQ